MRHDAVERKVLIQSDPFSFTTLHNENRVNFETSSFQNFEDFTGRNIVTVIRGNSGKSDKARSDPIWPAKYKIPLLATNPYKLGYKPQMCAHDI